MFGVKIEGRMGNQMFQYAFALAQKDRLKEDFYLDCYYYFYVKNSFILHKYFSINTNITFRNAWKKFRFYCSHKFRPPIVIENQWLDASQCLQNARSGMLYKGFFQSEQYFLNIRDKITRELTIKEKYRINIRDFTGNDKETIVVHIRKTDYLHWGSDELQYNLSLPDTYYHRCLERLDRKNKNIVFLSDDIEYVKNNFRLEGALFSEGNSQIMDLQLLMQADHLILSNSSFSWWGAYLNNTAQEVFAPAYWLGFKVGREFPNGVIRPGWKATEVL